MDIVKIWGLHGGDYEDCRLLGYYTVWLFTNRRFGGVYHPHHQGDKIGELGTTLVVTTDRSTLRRNTMFRLLVAAEVPSSLILFTLMM
jgi:hypothetical protein